MRAKTEKKTINISREVKDLVYELFNLKELEDELDLPVLRAVFNRIIEHIIEKTLRRTGEERIYEILDLAVRLKNSNIDDTKIDEILKFIESKL